VRWSVACAQDVPTLGVFSRIEGVEAPKLPLVCVGREMAVRLIYEARRGRCAEVDDDEGGAGMIGGIWDTAFEKRVQGYPPRWRWLWLG
jgi:hypothetical protein